MHERRNERAVPKQASTMARFRGARTVGALPFGRSLVRLGAVQPHAADEGAHHAGDDDG